MFKSTTKSNVVISTINFNSHHHTIKLIESLLVADLSNSKIIICDNFSADDSCLYINSFFKKLDWKSNKKSRINSNQILSAQHLLANNNVEFIFLKLRENFGFAKANNIAYTYANKLESFDYFWLLNNDATILNTTLPKLVEAANNNNNNILLSSLIFEDNSRRKVWFSGGVYNKYFAIGNNVSYNNFKKSQFKFLSGCSLFIPVKVIQKIGLLNDKIFLYAEDLEFSMRATMNKIPLDVVESSIVFHVGGASAIKRSYFAYYNIIRYTISVIINHHNKFLYITIIPYHILKIFYLFFFKFVPLRSLKGYILGIIDAISTGYKIK